MGRILEYVILLSNLSVIFCSQLQNKKPLSPYKYERPTEENFTFRTVRQFHPKDHQNDFFGATNKDKVFPPAFQGRRSLPLKNLPRTHQTARSSGLHAFSSENFDAAHKGRQSRNGFNALNYSSRLSEVPKFAQNYSRNGKNFRNPSGRVNYSKWKSPRPSLDYDQNNSYVSQNRKTKEDPEKLSSHRRDFNSGRSPRFFNHKQASKVCDPCNSVPWVPIFKESNSYRQQRNQVTSTNLYNVPTSDFAFDHSAYSSINHNVLLPPTPLIPPLEPIYDGTISSSFGLPIGNIPTSHGLLAPINHLAPKINRYGADSINYINSIKYYPSQSILDTNPFPELSPVPIVPIHDAGQFYQMESTIASLVPPTTASAGVPNVVLTISEANSGHGQPSQQLYSGPEKNPKVLGKDQSSESSSTVNVQSVQNGNEYQHNFNHNHNYGDLEIVKSIPVAEFSSSGEYSMPLLHIPSSDPENLSHFLDGIFIDNPQVSHKVTNENVQNPSNMNFLVPPVVQQPKEDTTFNSSAIKPFLNPPTSTELRPSPQPSLPVPKPLNSASISWLFSDHTAVSATEPNNPEPTSHPFIADNKEIASIVNNELRPVFPSLSSLPSAPAPIHSFPLTPSNSQSGDNTKNKKIQIIIPYTTKNKNTLDNNELESVQHEVYQSPRTPVKKSPKEGNSADDSTTPPHLPLNAVYETNSKGNNKEHQNRLNFKPEKERRGDQGPETEPTDDAPKYLSEMQHIIAKNIRELLRGEIDKTRDQSTRLQSNIDNWTALEYSNHKTIEGKAPKEIISQALTVTSIPGTSISHSLLPSKKIPNEYFITTPLPVYEEPNTLVFNTVNVSVNSRPFTARPYATTNLYFPATKAPEESKQKTSEVTSSDQKNHEKNYTDVGRSRVNHWGRLNENLVLPEARSTSRKFEETTPSYDWTSRILSSPVGNEKIQIVTPVSLTTNNYTTNAFRRTTRHVRTTEKAPQTTKPTAASTTQKNEIKTTTFETNKKSPIPSNTTRLEKVSNVTSPFNKYFPVEVRNSSSTSSSVGSESAEDNVSGGRPYSTLPTASVRNVFSEELIRVSETNKSDQFSINDVFPFRNKELPWESVLNVSQPVYENFRQRKSLIKQVKFGKTKTTEEDS